MRFSGKNRSPSPRPSAPVKVQVSGLTHDGRGVARDRQRVIFIDGAVPGDEVQVRITRQNSKRMEGVVGKLLQPSAHRTQPVCPWYGQCGGCNLQHVDSEFLLQQKQEIALGQLRRFAGMEPETLVAPLASPVVGYRSRARLSVRWWNKELQFGFRAAGSKDIVSVSSCAVLVPELEELLPVLRRLLLGNKNKRAISHIELTHSHSCRGMLLRTPLALNDTDIARWQAMAKEHAVHLFVQPDDTQSVTCIYTPDGSESLTYELAQQNLRFRYLPVDFTQINTGVNQQMVTRAMEWLAPQADERILDLFCGLGNFTLPLARAAREVVGVEGVMSLVERGRENARLNRLDNVAFCKADLAADPGHHPWAQTAFDALLLDPPRTGALDILERLKSYLPRRILYVSCNPATLARDASLLKEQGYRLTRFCVMDMFPQTAHVESMGLFIKD